MQADETAPPSSARDGMIPLPRLECRGTNSTFRGSWTARVITQNTKKISMSRTVLRGVTLYFLTSYRLVRVCTCSCSARIVKVEVYLEMEVARSSEMSVNMYQTTWRQAHRSHFHESRNWCPFSSWVYKSCGCGQCFRCISGTCCFICMVQVKVEYTPKRLQHSQIHTVQRRESRININTESPIKLVLWKLRSSGL
jgi:hypothetical protein